LEPDPPLPKELRLFGLTPGAIRKMSGPKRLENGTFSTSSCVMFCCLADDFTSTSGDSAVTLTVSLRPETCSLKSTVMFCPNCSVTVCLNASNPARSAVSL